MLIILSILIPITLVGHSYIFANKLHMENSKIYNYIINIVTLIIDLYLFALTIENKTVNSNVIILMIIITVLNIYAIVEWIYIRKRSINKELIKMTIDNSSSGIIALKSKDKVMFRNSQMYELMKKIKIHNNYVSNVKEKAIEKIGDDYVIIVEDKAWLFCISEDEKEITSFDISKEYELQKELEEQNKKANENNSNIMWTIDNLEEIEREEKTLKIKNKFHDLLGQNLSVLQVYLNQEINDNSKFEEVKFMIKKMFTQLEDTDDSEIDLENLIKVHKNIGININVTGELPRDKDTSRIFFEIIREAVTNAIRHANSNKINIEIKQSKNITMKISNNGIAPKDTITEHQGIKGMRRRLNRIKGSMFITTKPNFCINVIV